MKSYEVAFTDDKTGDIRARKKYEKKITAIRQYHINKSRVESKPDKYSGMTLRLYQIEGENRIALMSMQSDMFDEIIESTESQLRTSPIKGDVEIVLNDEVVAEVHLNDQKFSESDFYDYVIANYVENGKVNLDDYVEAKYNNYVIWTIEVTKEFIDAVAKRKKEAEPVPETEPEEQLEKPMDGYLKSMDTKIKGIQEMVGSLSKVEKEVIGDDVFESIHAILSIAKQIMGAEPEYKLDESGKVVLDQWNMPEVVKYSFEQFNIKKLLDFQFQLAGHIDFIAYHMAKFQGNAGLKKAVIDMASNYVYTDAKIYIQDILKERRTDKHIESIIINRPHMIKAYANQRVSASVATMLDTVVRSAELMRNVLNSTISYLKEDLINSMHLSKSQT